MQDGAPIIIKKIKKADHGHHGGAWKIALADFMTAMFCFFLVMWLLGLTAEDRAMIQAYFNDPIGFSKNPPRLSVNVLPPSGSRKRKDGESGSNIQKLRNAKMIQNLENGVYNTVKSDAALSQMMKDGKIKIRVTNEGLVIEFIESVANGEVFFELGSAVVRPAARSAVEKVARILTKFGSKVKIQGHTDARPFHANGMDNYDLSGARANAVRRIMLSAGFPSDKVMDVEALAATQPRIPKDPYHFSNRRVTVLLPLDAPEPDIKTLPKSGFGEDREAHFILPRDQAAQATMPKERRQDAAPASPWEEKPEQ